MYGNRGCLHDEYGAIRRPYATTRWIACQLEFRGRHRPRLMAPGRYTELFFLDDATALAAGHRPCAECRRADYNRLTQIWNTLHPEHAGADAIDGQLHGERLDPRTRHRRLHDARYSGLPDGAFVLYEARPWLVRGSSLLLWSAGGYAARRRRPARGQAQLITPPSLVAALRSGWAPLVPLFHVTAS